MSDASGPPAGPPSGPPSGPPAAGPPSAAPAVPSGPPPSGPPPSEPYAQAYAEPAARPPWLIPAAIVAVVVLIIAVIALSGGDDDKKKDDAASGGEIFLQAADEPGPDPFTSSTASPAPTSTIPRDTPIDLGSQVTAPVFTTPKDSAPTGGPVTITPISGAQPGLYGGTRDQQSCDKQRVIDFLNENPAKKRAWADAQGIPVDSVDAFIEALTPVVLRSDTRVTNHGFKNGKATPHQDVLQAGTAVLVDDHGVPRARCACGNPLLAPKAMDAPRYTGPKWQGFSPANVTVINQSTTVINVITIIDLGSGTPFDRPTGPNPGPDRPRTPKDPSNRTTTTGTTPPASTTYRLVEAKHTIGELASLWTVDDSGQAVINLEGTGKGIYTWTVPQEISPDGTEFTWGGRAEPDGSNISIDITAEGTGVEWDLADRAVSVPGGHSGQKSAIAKPVNDPDEIVIRIGMGYSVTAILTYRRS